MYLMFCAAVLDVCCCCYSRQTLQQTVFVIFCFYFCCCTCCCAYWSVLLGLASSCFSWSCMMCLLLLVCLFVCNRQSRLRCSGHDEPSKELFLNLVSFLYLFSNHKRFFVCSIFFLSFSPWMYKNYSFRTLRILLMNAIYQIQDGFSRQTGSRFFL